MANAIKVFDANEMKRRLNSHMASAIFKGVANISMGKDSSSATEFMRGYERGAIDTANIALGTRLADAVEVVHAWWEHLGGDEWCCTACGEVITTEGSWEKPTKKFCNECGAKMDGDGNG